MLKLRSGLISLFRRWFVWFFRTVCVVCTLWMSAQDSFEWTDKAASKRWTDQNNWSPNGDPNGSVTVLFPKGSKPTLDADRVVGLLDLRGELGKQVTITGNQRLQTLVGLNWDESALSGSGTFIAGGTTTFEGKADFGNWDVRLPQGGRFGKGSVQLGGNRFLISGNFDTGPGFAGVSGSGQLEILGSMNVRNTSGSGLETSAVFSGEQLGTRIQGNIHVEQGRLTLENATIGAAGSTFSTGSEGQLIIRTDFLELNSASFVNGNRLEIQVKGSGEGDNIEFRGQLSAGGDLPTVLRNLSIRSIDTQFQSSGNGAWKFSGKQIEGAVQNEGSFIWASGDLNRKPETGKKGGSSFVNLTRKPNPLLIASDSGTKFPITLSGNIINRGDVVQESDLTLQESAKLTVAEGGFWELREDNGIKGFVHPHENTLLFEKGSILRYLGSNPDSKGGIHIPSSFTNARIETATGQFELNQRFHFTQSEIIFQQPDSKVLLNGDGLVEALAIKFNQGNRVRISHELKQFRSIYPSFPAGSHVFLSEGGVEAIGKISAQGNGSLLIDSGTLLVGPKGASFEFESGMDFEGSGAFLDIAKSGGSGKPAIALFAENPGTVDFDADPSEHRIRKPFMNLSATTLFREGSIETLPITFPDGTIPTEAGGRGTINNQSGSRLEVLSGKAKILRNINLMNKGTILHTGQSGNWLQMEFATLSNLNSYELLGDCDIRFRGDVKKTCFENKGTLEKTGGTGTSTIAVPLDNQGQVVSKTGTLKINLIKHLPENAESLNGGRWTVTEEGNIRFMQLTSIKQTEDVFLKLSGKQANFLNKNGHPIFRPSQPIELKRNSRITLENDAVLQSSQVDIGNQAQLGGSGMIDSPKTTVLSGGMIAPGNSPGRLIMTGDFEMKQGAVYAFEAASQTQDQLIIEGEAKLGGVFQPGLFGDFRPVPGTRFPVLQATTISGTFEEIDQRVLKAAGICLKLIYSDTLVEVLVEPSQPDQYSIWWQSILNEATLPLEAQRPDADPDSDGIPNVMEFALGTSPTQNSTFPVSLRSHADDNGPSYFVLDVPRDPRSIAYRLFIEISPDLREWERVPHYLDQIIPMDRLEQHQLRLDIPNEFSNFGFLRLGLEIHLNPHL